ncbi:MAG: transglycosylase SLT domain-containing protein [Muribaculaceae bacterium]|nr:transglycosylase SLT domain-containing protein [Muribaculaceae bacterium]
MKATNRKLLSLMLLVGAATFSSAALANSILDLKHSLSDDNIIAPESFETKTRELEENFYLRNFIAPNKQITDEKLGTAQEYEKRLSQLPAVIEMPYNSVVGNYINMYLGRRRGLVADMLALHSYYGNIFVEELLKEDMPTELQYLPVIESAINPNAVSRAGATGLWQFMPGTAKGLGMEINSLVDERRDPRVSSRNAARYLKQLYNIYDDWSLAIAAYNCGPGNVNKAIRRAGGEGKKDFWEIYNYLPSETRGYVPAFIAANYVMNYYHLHNIAPTVVKRHLTTDTVTVNHRVHFQQIADILNIPIDEIRMLNPQFRKDIIPGDNHPYLLTLPKQQCLSYIMSEQAILAYNAELYAQRTYVEPGTPRQSPYAPADSTANPVGNTSLNAGQTYELAQTAVTERTVTKTHVVARGENIRDIAKMYAVSATDIKRWNHLRRGKVKEGDQLVIEVVERIEPDAVATNVSTVPTPATPTPARTVASTQTTTPQSRPATPAKTTQPAKPAKPRETTKNYTVKNGDSLERIAKTNGTTVDAIRKANGMKNNETIIRPGQKLKVPSKGSTTSTKKSTGKKSTQKSTKKSTKKSSRRR